MGNFQIPFGIFLSIPFLMIQILEMRKLLKIDSGASANVLPEQYVSPAVIETTTTVLKMYNKSIVQSLGERKVKVYNPANGHTYTM